MFGCLVDISCSCQATRMTQEETDGSNDGRSVRRYSALWRAQDESVRYNPSSCPSALHCMHRSCIYLVLCQLQVYIIAIMGSRCGNYVIQHRPCAECKLASRTMSEVYESSDQWLSFVLLCSAQYTVYTIHQTAHSDTHTRR